MSLYTVEVIRDELSSKNCTFTIEGEKAKTFSMYDAGNLGFIVVMEKDFGEGFNDNFRRLFEKFIRRLFGPDTHSIYIMGVDPSKIKFFRVNPADYESLKPKRSLHSRKIKRRRKLDSNNTKKEDAPSIQKSEEEEKISEEETSSRTEESKVGGFWPF